MDETVLQEIFDEVFSALEALETENGAMLQFLKNQGVVQDEEFAIFLQGAGKASSVRWRATRARVSHLLTPKPADASKKPPASAHESRKEEQAIQQGSEEQKDSAKPEKGAAKTEPDSRAEEDKDAQRQASDGSNPKVDKSTADKPASADASKRDAA